MFDHRRLSFRRRRPTPGCRPASSSLVLLATFAVFAGLLLPAPAQGLQGTFYAVLKNASAGGDQCLVFGGNGHNVHPERFNWGSGPYCGLAGGKEELFANRQALWTVVDLGGGEYVLKNSARGVDECLVFGGNGHDAHPSRYNWGPGPFCGFPGGESALRANRQAVWKLTHLEGERYMITNASRGADECLIFGGNGSNAHPERYNWGPGPFCGFPGGKDGLLANQQAVFTLERLRIDDFVPPQAWLDGYLILQNELHAHQRLHVGHDGNGRVYTQWGDDRAYRWQVEPTGDGHFFYLTNALHPQRLRVSSDGAGQLSADWGYDDAYRWTAEPAGRGYFLRNKMYPHQRLYAGHDGNGLLYAGWGNDPALIWTVQVLPSIDAPADNTFRVSPDYHYNRFLLENGQFITQRLHVGHDGNGQLYAEWGDDDAYRFQLEPTADGEHFYLRNSMHSHQRLHVGHDGNGQLYAEWGDDDAYKWKLEPVGTHHFYLRNKLHPGQRLQVPADGSGRPFAGSGSGWEHRWRLRQVAGLAQWPTADPPCYPPDRLQHLVLKICFYPGENRQGQPWCRIHDREYAGSQVPLFKAELPDAVAANARSASTQNCDGTFAPPTAYVYDEPGQRSDTAVVEGGWNNLGDVAGNARSYTLQQNPKEWWGERDNQYVCFHKGDDGTGRKHCAPLEPGQPVRNLSSDFNDQVRSVRAHPDWLLLGLDLWQHHNSSGQWIYVGLNENLKNRPIAVSIFDWKTWAEVLSSYRIKEL